MMNSKRVFFLMIGVCVLLSAAVLGVVVAGNNILKQQAEKLVDLKLEDRLLDEQQAALTKANQDILEYEELENIAKTVVPQDKDQARAVREIVALARESGISIATISFPSSNLGAKVAPAKPAAEGEAPAKAAAVPTITQAKPVEGVPGVYALEMTITPNAERQVSYYQLLDFLEKLENNRRTAQVTSVKITPITDDGDNPYVSFSLTLNIFVKP
jgi:hypothetical protein